MEDHFGQVIEKIIRRDGYSISELARLTNVNRRSVYNWFKQKRLKPEIIYRIGKALNYDFSNDFPKLFPANGADALKNSRLMSADGQQAGDHINQDYWKDKYINLLEKHNDMLKNNIKDSTPGPSKNNST